MQMFSKIICFSLPILMVAVPAKSVCAQVRISGDGEYSDIGSVRCFTPLIPPGEQQQLQSVLHPSTVAENAPTTEMNEVIRQQLGFEPAYHVTKIILRTAEFSFQSKASRYAYDLHMDVLPRAGGSTGISPVLVASYDAVTGKHIPPRLALFCCVELAESELGIFSMLNLREPVGVRYETKVVDWQEIQILAESKFKRFLEERQSWLTGVVAANFDSRGEQQVGANSIPYVAAEVLGQELKFYYLNANMHSVFSHEALY